MKNNNHRLTETKPTINKERANRGLNRLPGADDELAQKYSKSIKAMKDFAIALDRLNPSVEDFRK